MTPSLAKNMTDAMRELAMLGLVVFIVFIAMMIGVTIMSMRDKAMRKLLRKRREKELRESESADLTTVLPRLSRNELKNFAIEEKKRALEQGEKIHVDEIDGLPLKPTVYFDPVADAAKPDDPKPKPKVMHSFLSSGPLPREEKAAAPSQWTQTDVDKKDNDGLDAGENGESAH